MKSNGTSAGTFIWLRYKQNFVINLFVTGEVYCKPLCASSSTVAGMLTMVNPIDFGGHSSKVKVTMVIVDKYGVRGGCYALCSYILDVKAVRKLAYFYS